MNRRTMPTLATMALLCFTIALPAGDAAAQQKTLKDQLVGAWTIITSEDTLPNGTKQPPLSYGANPKGILILDASGRYAWMAGKPDRPKFKASAPLRVNTPDAEWVAATKAFAANSGTWSVNEADKTLTLKREIALVPNTEGTEDKNSVSLAGDELRLVDTSPAGVRNEEVYRRAK
jgi:hypothetical protein